MLVNNGKFEDAVEVFEGIPDSNCVDWSASFQTIFHGLVENRRFTDCVKLLRNICNNGGIGVKWKVSLLGSRYSTHNPHVSCNFLDNYNLLSHF